MVKLLIQNNACTISGDFPIEVVKEATSYTIPGYKFSPLYRAGHWDGTKSLFSKKTSSFPAGLVSIVVKALKEHDKTLTLSVEDTREKSPPPIGNNGFDLLGIEFGKGKFSYQLEAANAFIKAKRAILKMATNCHAKDQGILMYDGSVKKVQDIVVGDQLMGPDSTPRNVLETHSGVGQLFKVSPNKGPSFEVTEDHLLTIYHSKASGNRPHYISDTSVKDYLNFSKYEKHRSKLLRTSVEFKESILPLDPYLIGLLLGDGSLNESIKITNIDDCIIEYCNTQSLLLNGTKLSKSKDDTKCPTYTFIGNRQVGGNTILNKIREIGLVGISCENKFIPEIYKKASAAQRLALLAGLIDTDGHLNGNKNYDFISKSKKLAEDVSWIARSLGFWASVSPCEKFCQTGGGGTYYRVCISGNLQEIPVLISYKKCNKITKFQRDPMHIGFTVEYSRLGEFYGFSVDKDNRYLLEDFTITHNSGKTAIASALTKHLSIPTLFLVSSIDLVKQTRKVFATRLGLPLEDIGFIGDSNLQLGSWITVGTPDTLINRLEDKIIRKFLDKIDLVFADEVHTAGSETFYEVLDSIPAYYRCGLSGTPLNRSDGANLKIIAQTGDICFEVPNKQLIDLGVSARPHIEFIKVGKPDLSKHKGLNWHSVDKIAITENKELNSKIVSKVNKLLDQGLFPIVLIDKIDHGDILENLLKKSGVKVKFSFGDLESEERESLLKQYANREIDCLIGSSILDTGIDCPEIDAIVFASGGKSVVRTLQRIGRGMRIRPDKDKVYIVDFANFCHKWLTKHSLERIKTYKKEDCFHISVVDD